MIVLIEMINTPMLAAATTPLNAAEATNQVRNSATGAPPGISTAPNGASIIIPSRAGITKATDSIELILKALYIADIAKNPLIIVDIEATGLYQIL